MLYQIYDNYQIYHTYDRLYQIYDIYIRYIRYMTHYIRVRTSSSANVALLLLRHLRIWHGAALPSNCTSLLGQIQLLIQRNTFPNLEKYIFDKYILKFDQYVHFETNIWQIHLKLWHGATLPSNCTFLGHCNRHRIIIIAQIIVNSDKSSLRYDTQLIICAPTFCSITRPKDTVFQQSLRNHCNYRN